MRRECRCDSGEPGKCACVFFYLHARLRVHRAPGIPCALFIEGAKELKEFLQTSGAWRREIAEVYLAPSLRANGSGERPPADRLREAIQFSPRQRSGLLPPTRKSASADSKPAIARESDGGSSQALLAMTGSVNPSPLPPVRRSRS